MGVGNDQLRLREDIVPVSTLQSATSRLLREVEAQRRPKVITRDGVAVAVLLTIPHGAQLPPSPETLTPSGTPES